METTTKHTPTLNEIEALRAEMMRLDKLAPNSEEAHQAWRRWAVAKSTRRALLSQLEAGK